VLAAAVKNPMLKNMQVKYAGELELDKINTASPMPHNYIKKHNSLYPYRFLLALKWLKTENIRVPFGTRMLRNHDCSEF
jgi:hypothetical protein